MERSTSDAHPHKITKRSAISRREFIQGLGMTAAGIVLTACQSGVTSINEGPSDSEPANNSSAGAIPTDTTAASTIAAPSGTMPTVAIARATSYDPPTVLKQVQSLLDNIGGVKDILAHGNKVAIKVNLTGGTSAHPLPGTTEIETYLTHPGVVLALCQCLRDAGVKDISIVEAVYEKASWPVYGYDTMAKSIGAILVDLTYADPYKDFITLPNRGQVFIYDKFKVNPILAEVDAFISVAKMKCHNTAGVTHTMKNLIGLVPYRFYTLNPNDTNRSAFHGQANETRTRLPGVIMDLNQARPINLSLLDGIMTVEGGEGPWIAAMTPIKPGLLFAGKNPVATDAVATTAMSFNPTTDYPNEPFLHAQNHLNMAAKLSLGTNRIGDIHVVGASLKDVTMPFKASY